MRFPAVSRCYFPQPALPERPRPRYTLYTYTILSCLILCVVPRFPWYRTLKIALVGRVKSYRCTHAQHVADYLSGFSVIEGDHIALPVCLPAFDAMEPP